jgi:hypothetical protein
MLLQEYIRPYATDLRKATLVAMGWEIMKRPPNSPDLTPSSFHLFGPKKVQPGG